MIIKKNHLLIFLSSFIALSGLISCSSTNGIDDFFTFNIEKANQVSISPPVSAGRDLSSNIPFGIDSADLAKNGTLQTLLKSVKLNRITFTPSDTSFHFSSLTVISDTFPSLLLAFYAGMPDYTGKNDSILYSNPDIFSYFNDRTSHLILNFHADTATNTLTNIETNHTLVFTAKPLQ